MTVKIIKEPLIKFTCNFCGTKCEAEEKDFTDLNTMPPFFRVTCAWCNNSTTCEPKALIAKVISKLLGNYEKIKEPLTLTVHTGN